MKYSPDTIIRFGKHDNTPVWEVIENDPTYLEWAIKELDHFELDNEAFELLQKKVGKQ